MFICARYIFVSIITLCCAVCMVLTMKPRFASPHARSLVFMCFGLSFIVPLIFMQIMYNPLEALPPNYAHLFGVASLYFLGVLFYILKIPERWSDKFDYVGNSHNIWHVLIMIGLAIDMVFSWQLYETRREFVCPPI